MTARLRERRAAAPAGEAAQASAGAGAETTPAAAKQAAVQRVLTRRRPDRGPDDSEFLPPQDVGEWADDAVATILPPFGPYAILITILEAARQGEASAIAAVHTAAALPAQEQYDALATLLSLPRSLRDAERVVAAVRAEWHRLGLQVTKPEPQQPAEAGAP
jgi:hypothetical protein